ncbi:MAG: DUF6268 family outer membrane beta-barrel protein [Phycisphaerales bacterium]
MNRTPLARLAAFTSLALASTLLAQSGDGDDGDDSPEAAPGATLEEAAPPPSQGQPGVSVSLLGGGIYNFASSFEQGGGEVSVARAFAGVSAGFRFDPQLGVGLRLAYEGDFYTFDGDSVLSPTPGVQPWGSVQSVQLGGRVDYAIDRQWRVNGALFVEFSGENQADAGDSFTVGGTIGATYSFSETFTIGGGALLSTRLEESVLVIPLIFIDWEFAEGWKLTNVAGPEAYPTGAGLEIEWTLNPEFALALGGRYEFRQFRLDDSGPASRAGGVGGVQSLPIWLRAEWRPTESWRLDAVVGISAFQQYELWNAQGVRQAQVDADPSLFVGAFVSYRF